MPNFNREDSERLRQMFFESRMTDIANAKRLAQEDRLWLEKELAESETRVDIAKASLLDAERHRDRILVLLNNKLAKKMHNKEGLWQSCASSPPRSGEIVSLKLDESVILDAYYDTSTVPEGIYGSWHMMSGERVMSTQIPYFAKWRKKSE